MNPYSKLIPQLSLIKFCNYSFTKPNHFRVGFINIVNFMMSKNFNFSKGFLINGFKNQIIVKGARQHNLKNISISIPRDKLVVVTGLSGSGKSSLAFDTIYAEGKEDMWSLYLRTLGNF